MSKLITPFFFLLVLLLGGVIIARAENTGVNVGVTVVCPGGDCSKVETITTHTGGCMDNQAENFKASADQDDGSCYYTLPVEDLSAEYDEKAKVVRLNWTKPHGLSRVFKAVVIMKKTSGPATSVNDGEILYDGGGSVTTDSDVTIKQKYYYTAFVRGGRDRYSTGVVTSLTIPDPGKKEPPAEEPDKDGPPAGPDPFRQLLSGTSSDPLTAKLSIGEFIFSQSGEKNKVFSGGRVTVRGSKLLTIWINYDLLPEDLKTIGVTLLDPRDRTKSLSLLLRANEARTRYEATIGELASGNYPIYIYIINFENQTIKRLSGSLLVTGGRAIVTSTGRAEAVEKAAVPTAMSLGLAVGAANLVVSVSGIASLSDLYLILLRGLGALLGLFGYRRRSQPWGTVYDAITKQPIDPAYVVVESAGQTVADAITDIDGRFGFFLPAGQYALKANKTHYQFPSQVLSGKERDELYDNLYFGETIKTDGQEVINRNIPLDPVGFDWNEFTKNRVNYFTLYSKRELVRARIINTIFAIGFILSFAVAVIAPSTFNFIALASYGVIYLFELLWKIRHRIVSVKKGDGEMLSFAIVKIYMSGVDQLIKTVVADRFGRFYSLVRPGTYYYTIEEKQLDGSYRQVLRSGDVEFKKGVFTEDIVLPAELPPVPNLMAA